MKIIVLGGGHGGLVAARDLAAGGHEVTVYEKRAEAAVGYDWHDDVDKRVFDDLALPLPPEDTYFKARELSLLAPDSKKWIKIKQTKRNKTYSFERKPLLAALYKSAKDAGVKVLFETCADGLIIDGAAVKGVVMGGEELFADLVIDSAGLFSPYRESLPESFGIVARPGDGDIFYVYKGFYESDENAEKDEVNTNRCYIMPAGLRGIAWCVQDPPTGYINVFVGQTGGLTREEIDGILDFLRKDNPCIGERLVRGGLTAAIPIRYPASRMVADGYAIVGDAAFMTVPLNGSGMLSSMYAGSYLAEAVNKSGSSSVAALWAYQAKFMQNVGARNAAIDVIRRWINTVEPGDLRFLLEKGIITGKNISDMAENVIPAVKTEEVIKRFFASGKKNLSLMVDAVGLLTKIVKTYAVSRMIPQRYSVKKAAAWEKDYNELFS
ncbi:MAG: NAD(P)/FAD-dependent oxidoreductase [Clostridiales bacterium]|jgi:flavin-dependent dehydrogenase|nr:NAD(P)/FAD-dependent oxidoreductase [Clostridiales bacterium]